MTGECTVTRSEGCSGDLIIPSSVTFLDTKYPVTAIGYEAFIDCVALTSVTIPNSVTVIGECAFRGCTGLSSITIPNSVTAIYSQAFWECTGLTSVTIPNSVTTVGNDVFSRCSGLTSITIPNSMTSIEFGMFGYCTGLTSVTIPNSVTTICGNAFCASGLTSVTIPNSVKSIGGYAFDECRSLISVEIGSGIKTIEEGAFYDCTALKALKVDAQIPPDASVYTFDKSHYVSTTLYVPNESKELYETSAPWEQFLHIDTIDNYKPAENGINVVVSDGDDEIAVYNLNGVKIAGSLDGLPRGLYIVRHGRQISKITI